MDHRDKPPIQKSIEEMSSRDAFDALNAAMDVIAIAVAWNSGGDGEWLLQVTADSRTAKGASAAMAMRAARDHELASQIVDAFMGHSAMYATSPDLLPPLRQVR